MIVTNSNGVNRSNGVNASGGLNEAFGVSWSNGVNESCGVSWSNLVSGSSGVNVSCGVSWSNGVNASNGVNDSNGVSWSYGVNKSYGVSCAIFSPKKDCVFTIFGKTVSRARFDEVMWTIKNKQGNWRPEANNAVRLYDASGKEWKKIDASKIKRFDNIDWSGMPNDLLEYIKSLPEFDAEIFKWVTNVDVTKPCIHTTDGFNFCPHCGEKLK